MSPRSPNPTAGPAPAARRRRLPAGLLAFAGYLALAVAGTWPAALHLDTVLLSAPRRFDCYGTTWLGEHFWRAARGEVPWLHDPLVRWPEGLDLRLADSFVYGFLMIPLRAVLSPVAAFDAYTLLGIAGTATAGWWMARRVLRAPGLAAAAAGLIVGFNGLAHTYRVEGEAYLQGGFFLPLFAGWLVLAARTDAPRAGALAGAAFAGLAWSSGYYLVDGLVVLGLLGPLALAGTLGGERPPWRAAGAFALSAALLVAPLAWMLAGALGGAIAARFPEGQDPLLNVALDSASLSGLLVPFPGTAHLRQGRIAWLGAAGPVLGLLALAVRRPREVLPWLLLGAVGVTLSLGPYLRLDDTASGGGALLPYAWLVALSRSALAYRMPIRFLEVAWLGLAAAAALFLDALRREGLGRRWRAALVALVAADGLLFTGFATDDALNPVEVPAAYAHVSDRGALFDFWGHDRFLLRHAGLSTFYQVFHGRPVLADFTRAGDAQAVVGRRLGLAFVSGDLDRARELLDLLADLGVSDVALHPASFPEADLPAIRAGLAALCEAVAAGDPREEADPVELYRIRPRWDPAAREAAWARVRGWMDVEEGS